MYLNKISNVKIVKENNNTKNAHKLLRVINYSFPKVRKHY